MKVGVIDIGTLKVKLLISDIKRDGNFVTKYQSNTLTCLGVRMEENGNKPHPEYLQQTIDELKRCNLILEKQNVKKIRVVSTHALREMGKVGDEISKKIKNEVGFDVEIITQDEEANLFFKAVIGDFKTKKDLTLVDIGGGSVQILIGNKDNLKHSFLLKTGTSTLWDKFTPSHKEMDFPKREEIRKMKNYILQELQPVPKNLKTPLVYGSSCIIDFFKGIRLPLQKSHFSPTHPYQANIPDIQSFLDKFWEIPYDTREEMFVSPTYRYMWGADKALLNVLELARIVQAPYIIPTNSNINKGLILSLT